MTPGLHPNRPSRLRSAPAAIAGLVLGLLVALHPASGQPPRERLNEVMAPRALTAIPKNLSGLTWNTETGTLFAVTNDPEYVFELTPEGDVLRSVKLRGFKDTEGITHIAGTLFAVVEERRGFLGIFHIPPDATEVEHDGIMRLELGETAARNKGFESVSYDPVARTIFTMREGKPFVRLAIPLDEGFRPGEVRSSPLPDLKVKDVASIVSDPDGSLWVLSEASSRIVKLGPDGSLQRTFTLRIDKKHFQPEGITLAPDGRIFVVGEPNILAVYGNPDD